MITIIYHVPLEKKNDELEWLRNQRIFPGVEDTWDWETRLPVVKFACIVSPAAAMTIKLRHKLDRQTDYKQR